MKVQIIGHRGAAGLAPENSLAAIKTALTLGVAYIEIDVRKTKDNQLVICHDNNLERMSGQPIKISEATLAQLQSVKLLDGSHLLSLQEALALIGKTPTILDIKDYGCARVLTNLLQEFPGASISVASFKFGELAHIGELSPSLPLYGLEQTKPLDILHAAKVFGFSGIGLNHWLLNPLTYWRARLQKLDIYVYTVNSPLIFWFIRFFYPRVHICSNYPNRFIHHR